MNQAEAKKRLIKLVHVAKRQLNFDEYVYRNLLNDITSKTSCSQMNLSELEQVVSYLKRIGFKVKKPKTKARQTPKLSQSASQESHKIRGIWLTMAEQGFVRDASEQALDSYISRMLNRTKLGQNISFHCQFLNSFQATHVLEALKNWHKRELIKWLTVNWQSNKVLGGYHSLAHFATVEWQKAPTQLSYTILCALYNEHQESQHA